MGAFPRACFCARPLRPPSSNNKNNNSDKPRLHVKIADFGLACMLGPAKTLAVSKVTNPRWSAPEVIRDSSVSTSADVFSFGIVMVGAHARVSLTCSLACLLEQVPACLL